jgi:hypothetical protein
VVQALQEVLVNKLKRLWYRLNSQQIWPEQVRVGDQLLFDFPGTGLYWTSPVYYTCLTWGEVWPNANRKHLAACIYMGGGSALYSEVNNDRLRRRRGLRRHRL